MCLPRICVPCACTADHQIDPGLWAQVGAAAFWCGSGRITATIAIIVLEITGEYSYLPAIGIAVLMSKWVGELLTDGFYHDLIHTKKIPYLADMSLRDIADILVEEVMDQPVSAVRYTCRCCQTTGVVCVFVWFSTASLALLGLLPAFD